MADGATGGMTVDVAGFKRQVERFSREYGVAMQDVMKVQMRLWMQDIMKSMPFRGAGRKKSFDAIKTDINRLFVPIHQREVLTFFAEQFGTKGTGKKTKAAAGKHVPRTVMFNWAGDSARMRGWHEKQRNRKGRVRYRSSVVARVGSWEFVNEMYVPKHKLNQYIRTRQKEVGKLKGGWAVGLTRYGGKMPASWINRHRRFGRASGRIDERGDGFLQAVNTVPYAHQFRSILEFSARLRQRDLTGNARKRIAREIEKENARRSA